MLRAMKEQLKTLALDKEKKFHSVLRKRVGKKATAILENKIKQLILLMPDPVESVYEQWSNQKASYKTKKLGGYMLSYLYQPRDLISEEEWGLFGYLDDAYFVATVYVKVLDEFYFMDQKLFIASRKLSETIKTLMTTTKSVIPDEANKIDLMVQGILDGQDSNYFNVFQK